tara:strand:+ start:1199 stop:1447 length:249 start_codon:yes stop_codon:yes gene_type:complete
MTVKIISDELITQINDQLKTVVEDAVKDHIKHVDWTTELDLYSLVQDELQNIDIMDHLDTSEIDSRVSDAIDDILPQLTISK